MKFIVYMEPIGKGRARTVRHGNKVITFTPDKTAHAESLIREVAMRECEMVQRDIPMYLEASFYRTKPKSTRKAVVLPVTKPDWDNYGKLLCDALEQFAYENDSQITTAVIRKRFGSPPRIEIELKKDRMK